jgi:hypothetical protein
MPADPVDLAWHFLSALIVLALPGAAWLAWLPGGKADFFERLADAVGLSIALTALFGLAAFYLDLSWVGEGVLTWTALALLVVFLLGLLFRLPSRSDVLRPRRWLRLAGSLLGLLLLIALVIWRLVQARSLTLPAWVDSVHHTLIVRLILERGGLPAALDPYIPVKFSYHYGFHLIAALFSLWSRSLPQETLLWLGQVINALVALSVYRLGKALWQDTRPAVLAALLVGFAFHMPAYYLTWGRYTLLTGLVVLPLAMAAAVQVSKGSTRAGDWLRLVLLTAGVALSHITALLLLGLFMALLLTFGLLTRLAGRRRSRPRPAGKEPELFPEEATAHRPLLDGLWQPASAALLGLALAAPWLIRVWEQSGPQANLRVISPLDASQLSYGEYILYLLGPRHNEILLILAGAGLIAALFKRSARLLAGWALLLALLTLPWGVRLDPFRPDHMAIVLFLPAALLIGDLVDSGLGLLARLRLAWLRLTLQGVLTLALLALTGWGAWNTRDVLNPVTIFTDAADVEAITWVESNTPKDARFLINTALWMGSIYRGVDGGYWLQPAAGRDTLLPPVFYAYGSKEYVEKINNWAERASRLTACDADFWSLVEEAGATFLYVHQGQGNLQPDSLVNCPGLVPVYRRDGVYIYEINK